MTDFTNLSQIVNLSTLPELIRAAKAGADSSASISEASAQIVKEIAKDLKPNPRLKSLQSLNNELKALQEAKALGADVEQAISLIKREIEKLYPKHSSTTKPATTKGS